MDCVFGDFDSKDLDRYVSRTTDTDEYAFYYPDRPEKCSHHEIGSDMGITARYDLAFDFFGFTVTDDDYSKFMQSLNVKHNELCNHVIHVQTIEEPMHIFIEVVLALENDQMQKHYMKEWQHTTTQPGENPGILHLINVAPAGMVAYHIKGNKICRALHFDINMSKLTP